MKAAVLALILLATIAILVRLLASDWWWLSPLGAVLALILLPWLLSIWLGPLSNRMKAAVLAIPVLAAIIAITYWGSPRRRGSPTQSKGTPTQGTAPPIEHGRPTDAPSFPWPPPAASAEEVLPNELLTRTAVLFLERYPHYPYQYGRYRYGRSRHGPPPLLYGDIDGVLREALNSNGYFEKSYYAVPGGFALVTRLEQIEPDGSSKPNPPRWSIEPFGGASNTFFSGPLDWVGTFLSSLLTAPPGYYRVIVFVVTPVPFTQSDRKVSRSEALGWLGNGVRWLPDSIAIHPYTSEIRCTVLIYEFECKTNASARLLLPSRLDSRTHLVNSGIWVWMTSW